LAGGGTPICPKCHNALIFSGGPPIVAPAPPPVVPTSRPVGTTPPPPQRRHSRRHRERKGNAALIAIVCSVGLLLFCVYVVYRKQRSNEARAQREMAESMETIQRLVTNAARSPNQKVDPRLLQQMGRPGASDGERMVKLQIEYLQEEAALSKESAMAMDEAGYRLLLDPDRLAADEGFKETHAILENVKKILKEKHRRAQALVDDIPKRAEALPLANADTKRRFLEVLQKSMERSVSVFEKGWDLQNQETAGYEEMVKFMKDNRDHWSVKDHQLVFTKQDDIDQFKKYTAKVRALSDEQHAMRQDAVERINPRLEESTRR